MNKVVVDTNVLVSSIIASNSKPSKILSLVSDNKVQLLYSSAIMDEYIRVLAYDKLGIMPYLREETIIKIIRLGILVEPTASSLPFPDEDDRIFYDAAKDNDAVLITGNTKHYPTESFIMTPSDFLAIYSWK